LTWSATTAEEGPVDEAASAGCCTVIVDGGGGTEKLGVVYSGGAA